MNRILKALSPALLILGLVFAQSLVATEPNDSEAIRTPISGAFNLTNQDGESVTESTYDGNYRLVFFGFTHCPDICPTTLSTVGKVLSAFGEDASSIKPLFISVDYERDTPESLANYVSYFHPSFDGLVGTEKQISAAAENFNTTFGKSENSTTGDWYHSSYLYLMDKNGKLLDLFSHAVSSEILAQELRSVIQ